MEQDRRTFLKSAALAAGYVGLSPLDARSFAAVQGANDRVRVVVVGFSDRFRGALLPSFLEHHKATNFDIVGVCDIWNRRRDEGKAALEKAVRPSHRAPTATPRSCTPPARTSTPSSSARPTSSTRFTPSRP